MLTNMVLSSPLWVLQSWVESTSDFQINASEGMVELNESSFNLFQAYHSY